MHLLREDLNLLVLFSTLAETRSVTRAAKHLALSQPAVSHALGRLRQLLDDALFIRGKEGFVLTARAEQLVAPVNDVLARVCAILQPPVFDPASASRSFRLAVSDYTEATLLPPLLRGLRREARGVRLSLQPVGDKVLSQLESGELDLSFWGWTPPGAGFHYRELFRERFIGVMHRDHPLAAKARAGSLDLDDYLSCGHVDATFLKENQGLVDRALERLGRARDIALHAPGFVGSLSALEGTDLLMSLPSRLGRGLRERFGLLAFELPFEIDSYAYALIWHARIDGDPGLAWLRERILQHGEPEGGDREASPILSSTLESDAIVPI